MDRHEGDCRAGAGVCNRMSDLAARCVPGRQRFSTRSSWKPRATRLDSTRLDSTRLDSTRLDSIRSDPTGSAVEARVTNALRHLSARESTPPQPITIKTSQHQDSSPPKSGGGLRSITVARGLVAMGEDLKLRSGSARTFGAGPCLAVAVVYADAGVKRATLTHLQPERT